MTPSDRAELLRQFSDIRACVMFLESELHRPAPDVVEIDTWRTIIGERLQRIRELTRSSPPVSVR